MAKSTFYLLFKNVAFFFFFEGIQSSISTNVNYHHKDKTKVHLTNIFKDARYVLKYTISICSK